jgi:hypothetical protein
MDEVSGHMPPCCSPAEPVGPLEIELAIPCSRCGYALAGLKTDGKCPECGSPTTLSVLGDRLEHALPHYVRCLQIGAAIAAIAVAAQLVCTLITIMPLLVCAIVGNGPPPTWLQGLAMFTFFILPGLCAGVALGGWWLVAMPDPARIGSTEDPRQRRRLRFVLTVETICWIVLVGLGLLHLLANVPPEVYIPIATASGIVAPLAILAHLLLSARFFGAMSRRLRNEFVERVVVYQTYMAYISTGLTLLCVLSVYLESERFAMVIFPTTLLALGLLGVIHIGMLEIIRRAATAARRACSIHAR